MHGKFDNALDEAIWSMSLEGADGEAGSSSEAPGTWAGLMRDGRVMADTIVEERSGYPNVTAAEIAFLRNDGCAGAIVTEDSRGFIKVAYYSNERDLEKDWAEAEAELSMDDGELLANASGRSAAGSFSTISEIKAANAENGGHWFEKGAMRFFNSKVESKVYGGAYFVTSERMDEREPRRYSVRFAKPDGSIVTVGEFRRFGHKEDAVDEIKRLLKEGHTPNGRGGLERSEERGGGRRTNASISDKPRTELEDELNDHWAYGGRGHGRASLDDVARDIHRATGVKVSTRKQDMLAGLTDAQVRSVHKNLFLDEKKLKHAVATGNDRLRGHRPNTSISDRRKAGIIEGLTKAEMDSMEIRIPTFDWKQVGGDMDPGAHGGVIAAADGDAIEVLEIQPVREHVGDGEAKGIGYPFWSKEGRFDLSDLSLSDPNVQSSIEAAGLGEHLLELTPEQRAVEIAVACVQAGHNYDERQGGWARDAVGIGRIVKWWGQDTPQDWEYIADEDDEFKREVLEYKYYLQRKEGGDNVAGPFETVEEAAAQAQDFDEPCVVIDYDTDEVVWDEDEELEPNARRRGSHRRNAEGWPRKINWPKLFDHNVMDRLLDMAAESNDPSGRGHVPDEVKEELSFTDELIGAARAYESALKEALEEVVEKYPPEDGASAEDLFDDDAPYLVLMGLMGHGVGIRDGSWDKHYDDTEAVGRLLKQRLGEFANSSGTGSIPQALDNAVFDAMERAGYETDDDGYVKKDED